MQWSGIMWRALGLALLVGLGVASPSPAQVRNLKAVAHLGKRFVALEDLAGMYGLPLLEPGGKTLQIRGQYVSLQFEMDSREAYFNGSKIWLHAPVMKIRGRWSIADADAKYMVDPLVRPSAYLSGRGTRTVVLDAGHGGKDPGAVGPGGLQEKAVVLDIALRTAAHLRANGVRVVLTRDADRFWELKDRPFLAARGSGDVFVSVHANAAGTRSVQGVETFVAPVENYPPTSDTRLNRKYPTESNNRFNHSNVVLGHHLQRSLVGITRAEDRGLKRARFQVLKDSAMPAALVECGFLTNPQEELKLSTPSYRETVAQGIAQGILNYLATVNRAKVQLGAPLLQPTVQMA
jgi:N-acetylmuramoyl-L-alanine amidase